jgi:hypothetical protein
MEPAISILVSCGRLFCGFAASEFAETMNSEYLQPITAITEKL